MFSKKNEKPIMKYQIIQQPDFFDSVDRIAISFDPLFKSTVGVEDKALLITVFEKCIDFCIEVEKLKIRNFHEESNTIKKWHEELMKNK